MDKCDIYEFNLRILLDSCPFLDNESELYDALYNYFLEIEADLNCLNIDDIVVNHLVYLSNDELDEDEVDIFIRDNNGAWVWQ